MRTRFLLTTAVGVVFATAAFAQSPKEFDDFADNANPDAAHAAKGTLTPQRSPSAGKPDTTAPVHPAPSSSQAQTTPSTSSQPGGTSAPAQAQTNAPAPSNNQAQQAPATGSSGNQAQQAPASSNTTAQQPSQNTTAQQPASEHHGAAACPVDQPVFEYGAVLVHQRQCVGQHQRPAANTGHAIDLAAERAAAHKRQLLALGRHRRSA